MKHMENTFPRVFNRKEYRACRYAYYFFIPILARCLWFEPDRARLKELEHDFYNMLLSYHFIKGNPGAKLSRVELWAFRFPTIDDGQSFRKL